MPTEYKIEPHLDRDTGAQKRYLWFREKPQPQQPQTGTREIRVYTAPWWKFWDNSFVVKTETFTIPDKPNPWRIVPTPEGIYLHKEYDTPDDCDTRVDFWSWRLQLHVHLYRGDGELIAHAKRWPEIQDYFDAMLKKRAEWKEIEDEAEARNVTVHL